MNEKLFIGNVGCIRQVYKGQVASYRLDTLKVEGVRMHVKFFMQGDAWINAWLIKHAT